MLAYLVRHNGQKKNPNSWFNVIKMVYVYCMHFLGYKNVCYGSFLKRNVAYSVSSELRLLLLSGLVI